MNEVEERVMGILKSLLTAPTELGVDTLILNGNLLDSYEILNLVAAIEEEFPIVFTPDDLTVQNFNSVALIAALISKRMEPGDEVIA